MTSYGWTEADLLNLKRRQQPATLPPAKRTRKVEAADLFPHFCELHGLPKPEIEVSGLVPDRKFRADYFFRAAGVVVEREGGLFASGRATAAHGLPVAIRRDMEKANLLQAAGYRVFRFMPEQLFQADTMELLRKVLA